MRDDRCGGAHALWPHRLILSITRADNSRHRWKAISAKGFDTVVRNNLTGGFIMARECYTQWMKANGGAIVNITADNWLGMPMMGHSGAARAGMVNLTETAALEWSGSNVRVNAVAPGWIASSGMDHYPPEMGARIRSLKDVSPLGRLGVRAKSLPPLCSCCRQRRRIFLARHCGLMAPHRTQKSAVQCQSGETALRRRSMASISRNCLKFCKIDPAQTELMPAYASHSKPHRPTRRRLSE